jgi:hypothetical protein
VTARTCLACGELLSSSARVDKTTCGPACRARLCRTRRLASNTSVTPLGAMVPRSGGRTSTTPLGGQTRPFAASAEAVPASPFPTVWGRGPRTATNACPDRLIRVLAEGLRAIEERRAAGQTESPNRAIIVLPQERGTKR